MAFDIANIFNTINSTYETDTAAQYGKGLISNIFSQNPSRPNFCDIHLGRSSDLDDISDGVFTISEHVEGYEAVANQPKLQRLVQDHWTATLDAMQVNGKDFGFAPSSLKGPPSGKIAAVFDTGFSLPPLPAAAVDYIYGSIEGAVVDNGTWVIPCLGPTNLTFVFGVSGLQRCPSALVHLISYLS